MLDELGIADDTIVFYSTDNGPHIQHLAGCRLVDVVPRRERTPTGKAAGASPRCRTLARAAFQAGSVTNEIVHHMDWFPTLAAAAGVDNIKEDLLDGYSSRAMDRDYRVHLDGYNILPLLTGRTDESPRKEIFYFSDTGDLTALRYDDWKLVLLGAAHGRRPPRVGRSLGSAALPNDLPHAARSV